MSITQEQLDDFYEVATDRIQQGDVQTSQELFDLWRLLNPSPAEAAEIHQSIERGIEEIRAGGGRSAREVTEELWRRHNLSDH